MALKSEGKDAEAEMFEIIADLERATIKDVITWNFISENGLLNGKDFLMATVQDEDSIRAFILDFDVKPNSQWELSFDYPPVDQLEVLNFLTVGRLLSGSVYHKMNLVTTDVKFGPEHENMQAAIQRLYTAAVGRIQFWGKERYRAMDMFTQVMYPQDA